MRRLCWMSALMLTCIGALAAGTRAAEVVLLDTAGVWRMHHTLRAPVMQTPDGLVDIPRYDTTKKLSWQEGQLKSWYTGLLADRTAEAGDDWMKPDFDDAGWVRGSAGLACRTPYLERLHLRGRFTVADPAKAGDLSLAVEYHGGAVVYVNGVEIARANIAADGLAEPYPRESWVDAEDKLITLRGEAPLWRTKPSDDVAARIAGRVRRLSAKIPSERLRTGVNVVAIEFVRAPYDQVVEEQKLLSTNHGAHHVFELSWNTCQVKRVQLVAAGGSGLAGSAVRPKGLQVWNSDPMATDYDMDFGDPAEPLRPIRVVVPVNGVASGKVGVGSDSAITGLAVKTGELKSDSGATLPASAVRIRYGMPWGAPVQVDVGTNSFTAYPAEASPLLALWDTAPATIAPAELTTSARSLKTEGQSDAVPGAVATVWCSVKPPADAAAGLYRGELVIETNGAMPVRVPLEVVVVPWKISDPQKWRTWLEIIQSPETLALEYGVERWSEAHWQLIDRSLSIIGDSGSRVLHVPLIARCNVGNEESMVRWIKKADGGYEYDFSAVEKYIDMATARLGKPEVIIFNVWDRYLTRSGSGGRGFQVETGLKQAKDGPMVTVLDRATGTLELVTMDDYPTAESKAAWTALFTQLRERMRARGLEQTMHLGMVSDFWADREQVEALNEITGKLPWTNAAHHFQKDGLYGGLAPCGYQSAFFGTQFQYGRSQSGWRGEKLIAQFDRVGLDAYSMVRWRVFPEQSVTSNVRGAGRLGGDTWHVVKDRNGRRAARVWERFPGGNWGYLNANSSVLAPGPDGAVATMRFESLREGAQEAEAIITLEEALGDKAAVERMGPELAEQCKQVLDERRLCMWKSLAIWHSGAGSGHEATSWRGQPGISGYVWYLGSGWQNRTQELFRLAAEVSRK